MAVEIDLTNGPVKLDAAEFQPLSAVIDVSKIDQVDLLCMLLGNPGGTTGPAIEIWTGMSADSETGWILVGTFTILTLQNDRQEKKNFSGLLKYLRWNVSGLGTAATSIAFTIRGMGRLY